MTIKEIISKLESRVPNARKFDGATKAKIDFANIGQLYKVECFLFHYTFEVILENSFRVYYRTFFLSV